MVKTQFSKTIKVFRSDNARELTQHAFEHILYSHGTVHQFSCPGTSQQNWSAERKLRHILDTVRALLLSFKVPVPFWGEAVLTVTHAINRIPMYLLLSKVEYIAKRLGAFIGIFGTSLRLEHLYHHSKGLTLLDSDVQKSPPYNAGRAAWRTCAPSCHVTRLAPFVTRVILS